MSKIYFLFLIFFISLQFLNCKNRGKTFSNDKTITDNKTIITVKLKKNEACVFNYCNAFFRHSTLSFSNSGNKDSIITKTIEIDNPTMLFCGIITMDTAGKMYETNNYFLIIPGDSINFYFYNQMLLKIDSLHANRFLNDPYLTYISAEVYKPSKIKQGDSKGVWENGFYNFYANLKSIKNIEKQKADSLFKEKLIDSNLYFSRNQHTDILFYSYYFKYFYKSLKFASDIIKKNPEANGVIELLNSPQYFIGENILDAFYGIINLGLLNKKVDFNSQQVLFDEAIKLNITTLKPALLSSFLNNTTTDTSFFKRVTTYISKEYKGTIYEKNCNELLQKKNLLDNIIVNDSLIELSQAKKSWQEAVISEKNEFVLVDFWASWCSPCRAQLPLLHKAKENCKNDPIEFISVNIDKNETDWALASKAEAAYLNENNYHLILTSKESEVIKKWSINTIPRYMIFKNGIVISKDFSNPGEPGFLNDIKKVIAENK